jgi:hypothetical protein
MQMCHYDMANERRAALGPGQVPKASCVLGVFAEYFTEYILRKFSLKSIKL